MRTALAFFIVTLVNAASSQEPSSFCDLLRNPEKFNGKNVTVRATFRYGFEWQELYCLDCIDRGKAWLDLPNDLDEASAKALKKAPKYAGIVNVTVQGTFVAGSTYGHQNGYRYQFTAQSIKNLIVVYKGKLNAEKEQAAEKLWACGGTNPR